MTAIGWSNRGGPQGQWGAPAALGLPADARGLLLGEGVFETVLVLDGRPQWLAAHLQRWHTGAQVLGLASPPTLEPVQALLLQAMERSGIHTGALRLNWCRGSSGRGLQPPDPARDDAGNALFWLQLSQAAPCLDPVRVIVSPTEVRSATSLLSRCKSFGYGSALLARRQALQAGADDALLPSSNGELCCGTSANLLIRRDGGDDRWLTPPLTSGCLGGIMRQRAIDLDLASETTISLADLEGCQAALLLNSLGCRAIVELDHRCLDGPGESEAIAQATRLWGQLLEPGPGS